MPQGGIDGASAEAPFIFSSQKGQKAIGAIAGVILAANGVTAIPAWISMFGTIFTRSSARSPA